MRLHAVDPESRKPDVRPTFGLTGGIACGKSTVAGFFRDLGAHIIDADRIGHEIIAPGGAAYGELLEHFGREIVGTGGEIDRGKLGARVFRDPQQLRALNSILHPQIIARIWELAAGQHAREPRSVVIIDAPLIFEAGMETTLSKVVVVWCRPEQQLERLLAKTTLPRDQAERRIASQMPLEEKLRRADYAIDCSGTLEQSRTQAQAIFAELRKLLG